MKNYLEGIDTERLALLAKEQKTLSYASLCKELGMEPVTSNSKKSQLKQLSQICRYEKEKTQYKIIEYYTNPIIIEDKKQKYQKYLEAIILGSLHKDESKIITTGDLREWLGLCNRNFKLLGKRADRTRIILNSQFDTKALNNMYAQSLQFFSQTIENCFRSLIKHKCITLEIGYRLFDIQNGVRIVTNVFSGDSCYSELKRIEKIVFEELKEKEKIHPTKKGFIANRKEQEKYWRECNKSACDKLNILSCCPVKKIGMCVERRQGDVAGAKATLNEKITEALLKKLCKENLSSEYVHDFIQIKNRDWPDYLKKIEETGEDYTVVEEDDLSDFQDIVLMNRTN